MPEGDTSSRWVEHVRESPVGIKEVDAKAIVEALEAATASPVKRQCGPATWDRSAGAYQTQAGQLVTLWARTGFEPVISALRGRCPNR